MKPQFKTISMLVGGLLLCAIALAWIWSFASQRNLNAWHHPPVHEAVKNDFYLSNVQPIFSARCIACHSCINSPCQLDLTSFDGLERGGSKIDPYNFPLVEENIPTRIGIDARDEQGWRNKGFHSVLEGEEKSILARFLNYKPQASAPKQAYHSESSRMCPGGEAEQLNAYFTANPRGQMPFGFSPIEAKSVDVLNEWISKGSRGPTAEQRESLNFAVTEEGRKHVAAWEKYFNETSFKSQLTSRYIYEHLFLAHIYFDELPGEFFRLIRAENEAGDPIEIATRRPYDDPGKKFFYRFKKYSQAIVAKTHMPYELSELRKKRWKELFFDVEWLKGSDTMPAYGPQAANAFATFQQIPAESRYRFLLENAYYHISTFIKGPVCRGQTALNVINDQFWVMFVDPSHDLSVHDEKVRADQAKRMVPPAAGEDKIKLFNQYREGYWETLHSKYAAYKSKPDLKFSPQMIWDGDETNDNALLTVYRHFDSAEVLIGPYGHVPKTVWVIDYQVFEDIYYNLVAGYDVYSPMIHQVNTRLYMEITRIASEDMFLNFLAQDDRASLRANWNRDTPEARKPLAQKVLEFFGKDVEEKMAFEYPYLGSALKSEEPKGESPEKAKRAFLTRVFNERFTRSVLKSTEHISGLDVDDKTPWYMFAKNDSVLEKLKPLATEQSDFAQAFGDVIFLRVRTGETSGKAYTIVHNKAHASVSMLLFENERREPWRDSLNVVRGFAASYPNMYLDVAEKDLPTLVERIQAIRKPGDYKQIVKDYGVERDSEKFWALHDWFYAEAKRLNPIDSGHFDLNRFDN